MSKKTKLLLIIGSSILALAIVAICLVVFLPRPSIKIKLQAPCFINCQVDEDKKLLITDNNTKASGYEFYICETDDYYDMNNYIKFESTTPYLIVTDKFVGLKTYHFYCRCLGNDKYEDSDFSEIMSYTAKQYITKPDLSIDGTMLSWTKVEGVKGYAIYCGDKLINIFDHMTTNSTKNYYDIQNYIGSSLDSSFNFYVIAVGDEFHFDSEKSNTVSYEKTYQLSIITNLKVNGNNIVWDKENNANKYEIVINGSKYYSNTNSLNASSIFTNLGDYLIKVKAIDTSEIYRENTYCETIIHTITSKLNQVSNIEYVADDNLIYISWQGVDLCNTYSIYIGNELYLDNITIPSIILSKSELLSGTTIKIQCNGYGYYASSNLVSKVITY